MKHLAARTRSSAVIFALTFASVFLAPLNTQAQTYKVLYVFTGGADGGQPYSGVTLDSAGNLFGSTGQGASSGCFGGTCGVVFELSPGSGGWTETTLHRFSGASDGGNPFDTPSDAAANLYGTAQVGGISCGHTFGCGVAFELIQGQGWAETVLHNFEGGNDGYYPVAGLVPDRHGNLYGTMSNGGNDQGVGEVYELTQNGGQWQKNTLYVFDGQDTGVSPVAAPILDAAGNLYGTTSCCNTGAVWELLHGSWKEKTLHYFTCCGGDDPWGGLAFDKQGNLYGTTRDGGGKNQSGKGVVFKLSKSKNGKWKETVLHVFTGGTDGREPFSTPTIDKAGNVYGTTSQDGAYGCGTVFKLSPHPSGHWKETILHQFAGGSDGCGPYFVRLAIDGEGNLYGTTTGGGNPGCYDKIGCGVVFEITP
jgi:uncharacterized repeat protein (TIGR03803 family)